MIGDLFAEFEVYRNFCFPRKIEIPKSCEEKLKEKESQKFNCPGGDKCNICNDVCDNGVLFYVERNKKPESIGCPNNVALKNGITCSS